MKVALAMILACSLVGCDPGESAPDAAPEADILVVDTSLEPDGPPPPPLEACDGLDNDGDGEVDEDQGSLICGVGECRREVPSCQDGVIQACAPLAPAVERCGDGLDNDCDGLVDEDCSCDEEGASQECGSRVGTCHTGLQTCQNRLWGQCEGAVAPSDEECDGLDNDCDLAVDQGCPCTSGKARRCGLGQGICALGWQHCLAGQWGPCAGAIPPRLPELCNGVDDNCDGNVDEGCPCRHGDSRACGIEEGLCLAGIQWCAHGAWGACSGAVEPQAEICDGQDNNCDGQVDEGYMVGTACGVGACVGVVVCQDGQAACDGAEPEDEDICNGIDDDCDGEIDEGACSCQPNEPFETTCDDHRDNDCDGLVDCGDRDCFGPGCSEVCGDDWDNDGNGIRDDGCFCLPGQTLHCPLQKGICLGTVNWCNDQGRWDGCHYGPVYEEAEVSRCADGWDNDCDGLADCDDPDCLPCDLPDAGDAGDAGLDGPADGTLPLDIPPDGPPGETICHDGLDDDEDGLVDCLDPDCEGQICGDTMTCQGGACLCASDLQGFCLIEAGSFTMGSPETELGRGSHETQHEVTLTRSFYLKAREVTQGEWRDMYDNNPSWFQSCGDSCPVETVGWLDALAYSNALSLAEGLAHCYDLMGCEGHPGEGYMCEEVVFLGLDCEGYRLPSEAEWEYAARAGTTSAFYTGESIEVSRECDEVPGLEPAGWYCHNCAVTYDNCDTHHGTEGGPECAGMLPVGLKAPNPWGLSDMLGNATEWVWDWFSPTYGQDDPTASATDPLGPTGSAAGTSPRLTRGGASEHPAARCRAAARNLQLPLPSGIFPGDSSTGLRPARTY